MLNLTLIEKVKLVSFLKTMINLETVSESLKEEVEPIYLKLRKELLENG